MARKTLSYLLLMLLTISAFAQSKNEDIVTPKILKELIDTLVFKIDYKYVVPEKGKQMAEFARKRYKQGAYNKITDPDLLADELTKDILSIQNDEHFFIEYNPKLAEQLRKPRDSSYWAEQLKIDKSKNFGFKKIEILNGNIGYIDISHFAFLNAESEKACNSAFQVLSNCDAVIIDMRYGLGGQPEMVCCIAKHFLKETTHILQSTFRNQSHIYNYYSEPDSNYTKLYDVPLYILTSYKTFSAAELLSYSLKNVGRATIVGEQTRGGAHSGPRTPLFGGFIIALPHGEAYSKVTKTNWEGVGVTPDIKVKADNALEAAELDFFEKQEKMKLDSSQRQVLAWQKELLLGKNKSLQMNPEIIAKRVGWYGYIEISCAENCLYYKRVGKAKFPLVPISDSKMRLKGNDSMIIEFKNDEKGNFKELITYHDDGRIEHSFR